MGDEVTESERVVLAMVGSALEIDEEGRVWRVTSRGKPVLRRRVEKLRGRYFRVEVRVDRKTRWCSAHRLVWMVAFGDIPPGLQVNHRNGNKLENRLSNLELATGSQNQQHRYTVLGHTGRKGERHHNAKLTDDSVIAIRKEYASGAPLKDLSRKFGISIGKLSSLARGLSWSHVGGPISKSRYYKPPASKVELVTA
jgi:hypothetical protein